MVWATTLKMMEDGSWWEDGEYEYQMYLEQIWDEHPESPKNNIKGDNMTAVQKSAIDYLRESKNSLQTLVPLKAVDYSVEHIIRQCESELKDNERLRACNPLSICSAVKESITLGLDISGSFKQASLIPYGKECKLDIQYQGLLDITRRSGLYKTIYAERIKEYDTFEMFNDEHGQHFEHKKSLGDSPVIGYYATATLKDGSLYMATYTKQEIDDLEKKTRKGSKMTPAWANFYDEMAKKTVMKNLLKWIPRTSDINRAVTIENETNHKLPTEFIDVKAVENEEQLETEVEAKTEAGKGLEN